MFNEEIGEISASHFACNWHLHNTDEIKNCRIETNGLTRERIERNDVYQFV